MSVLERRVDARREQEELREFLDDEERASTTEERREADLQGLRGWDGAHELEQGLVKVFFSLFDLSRANTLPEGLTGARGASELHEAAVALGAQEAPQIIALLPM